VLECCGQAVPLPAQNLVDELGGAPEQIGEVWSIGHQTSHFDVFAETMHRRYPRAHAKVLMRIRLVFRSGWLTT